LIPSKSHPSLSFRLQGDDNRLSGSERIDPVELGQKPIPGRILQIFERKRGKRVPSRATTAIKSGKLRSLLSIPATSADRTAQPPASKFTRIKRQAPINRQGDLTLRVRTLPLQSLIVLFRSSLWFRDLFLIFPNANFIFVDRLEY